MDIISIDDTHEAIAARSIIEWFGGITRTYFIGKAQDVVKLLGGGEKLSPNILLMCHGVDEGIVLPELAEEIAKTQPYNKYLTAENLKEFLKLDGQLVLNTGCKTGKRDFADAFINAGARYYIGPVDYPEGDASLIYVINFYYYLIAKNLSIIEAHEKAKSIDSETVMFELFSIL